MKLENLLEKRQITQIEADFSKVDFGNRKKELLDVMEKCDDTERVLLKYIYAYMPASDLASYDGELFAEAVKASLYAIERVRWGEKIKGELFLNFVLSFRLNNENLVPYKRQFFDEIYPRIKDMTMEQAAIEVNYWCFEKATYQSTDIRTSSSLNVIRNAFGRCGEESVLCVSALRSVGIPARQCYTPRWAHCDDNHAWVEVWIDGKWHFIGACEPEPVLDKGWFAAPAQRGMLIHARIFSRLVSQGEITIQTPVMTQLNILENYTETRRLEVSVTENGKPRSGLSVAFELINFAQLYPLATLKTDESGTASMTTGLGDLWIHVTDGTKFMSKKADMRLTDKLHFDFENAVSFETDEFDLDMTPPAALNVPDPEVSENAEKAHIKRTATAKAIREAFENTFVRGGKAKAFAADFFEFNDDIADLISMSNGNHEEIAEFLKDDFAPLKYRVALLKTLNKKDLSDSSCKMLKSHLSHAMKFAANFSEDIFINYVASPRVYFEMLSEYREFLENYFTDEQKVKFIAAPAEIYKYIDSAVKGCGDKDYETISANPDGLLRLGYGSLMSKRILFTAICRTLGIAARMSKIDLNPEYYADGEWKVIAIAEKIDRSSRLTLISGDEKIPEYEKDFTVARLTDGKYVTLDFTEQSFENGKVTYDLQDGHYRITTICRLTDGTVLSHISHLNMCKNESKTVKLIIRNEPETNVKAIDLTGINVVTADNTHTSAKQLLPRGVNTVMAWLNEGAEPTEHILNEILEAVPEFKSMNDRILFLLQDKKSPENITLAKVLEKTQIRYAFLDCGGDTLKTLLSELGATSSKLPLIMAMNDEFKCVFHTTGYNVGTGSHLLKHLK